MTNQTPLADVIEVTDQLSQSDYLLVLKDEPGADIQKVRQKEISGINQVPRISVTSETSIELNFLNGISSNFVIDLRNATETSIDLTFTEPLLAEKRVAKNIYFRIVPNATNAVTLRWPNTAPNFVKFINGFTSNPVVPAGSGGASELHWMLHLEGGWSIGRISEL